MFRQNALHRVEGLDVAQSRGGRGNATSAFPCGLWRLASIAAEVLAPMQSGRETLMLSE